MNNSCLKKISIHKYNHYISELDSNNIAICSLDELQIINVDRETIEQTIKSTMKDILCCSTIKGDMTHIIQQTQTGTRIINLMMKKQNEHTIVVFPSFAVVIGNKYFAIEDGLIHYGSIIPSSLDYLSDEYL